jgi:amino acid efflux transporter
MKQNEILGVKETVAYYISNLVGAGILVIPAIAYSIAGETVLLVWGLLILMSWPLAKTFANISIQSPHNSGILNYLHSNSPKRVGQFADDVTVFVMLVGNPILGFVAARYALSAFNLDYDIFFYPLAFFFMCLSVCFNLLGLRNSSQLQSVLTFITLAVLLTLAGLAVWWNGNSVESHIDIQSNISEIDFLTMLETLGICFFVFVGWENVAAIAPNVKDRKKTFNRAILISVPIVGICYLFIAFALSVSVTASEIGTNFAVLDHLTSTFSESYFTTLVSLFSIFVVVVSCNAWVLAAGKVINGLSTEGRLPKFLSIGSEETPHIALVSLVLFYAMVVIGSYYYGNQEDLIIRYVSAGFILIYLTTLIYYFFNSKSLLTLIAIIMTLLAASGVYVETLFLCFAGATISSIRYFTQRKKK